MLDDERDKETGAERLDLKLDGEKIVRGGIRAMIVGARLARDGAKFLWEGYQELADKFVDEFMMLSCRARDF